MSTGSGFGCTDWQAGLVPVESVEICNVPNTGRAHHPLAGGERKYARSGHQSQKGRENISVAGGTYQLLWLLQYRE
eukprot:7286297-Pyramimonas_sp.AAC.1